MLAILGGTGAALVFATVTLCNSRSSRVIGPSPLLGWIMLEGLVILAPIVAIQGIPEGLDGTNLDWMAVAGVGNVVGLLLAYAALRVGKVGIVAPLVSTQGAIAAVIAVIAGESIGTAAAALLVVIVAGVFLAGIAADPGVGGGERHDKRATLYAGCRGGRYRVQPVRDRPGERPSPGGLGAAPLARARLRQAREGLAARRRATAKAPGRYAHEPANEPPGHPPDIERLDDQEGARAG
jgi:uncharacterized membrane protein